MLFGESSTVESVANRLFDLLPGLAMDDLGNRCLGNTVFRGECVHCLAERIMLPNQPHLLRHQLRPITSARAHVPPVIGRRSQVEVVWPNTRGVIAMVQHPNTLRDRPICEPPHRPVRRRLRFTPKRPHAVTVPLHIHESGPLPTSFTNRHVLQESLKLRHPRTASCVHYHPHSTP